MGARPVKVDLVDLKFCDGLYPRQNIDDSHIRQFERAMMGGIVLPPIIVAKDSLIIVDGVHRYHAHLRRGENRINAIIKTYANEAELWHDAVQLNSGHGLKLGQDDCLKVLQTSERLGLKEIDIATMLRTSVVHLRLLKPRYANIEEAAADVKKMRKVALKGSVRHLSGETITPEQEQAMRSAPGQSYLLNVNQLLTALKFGLLPRREDHLALWSALEELAILIQSKSEKHAA